MQHAKRWLPLVLLTFMLLLFTACGESLQKPTGLEDDSSSNELVDNEAPTSTAKEDDEESKEDDADDTDETANEDRSEAGDEQEDKSSTNKDSDNKKDLASKVGDASQTSKDRNTSQTSKEKTAKSSAKAENKTRAKSTGTSSSKEKSTPKQSTKPSTNSSDKKSNTTKSSSSSKDNSKSNSTTKPNNSGSSNNDSKKEPEPPKKDTVTISIVISSSEVPLSATSVEISNGDKVLDPFLKVTREKGIQQSVRGGGSGAYIEGINNVYEFDRGQGSGWMYRINGVFPDRGVGAVPVQNGDRIEFLYTLDLGKDLNANLQPYRR